MSTGVQLVTRIEALKVSLNLVRCSCLLSSQSLPVCITFNLGQRSTHRGRIVEPRGTGFGTRVVGA